MDWHEIILKVRSEDLETASAISNMTVDYGIYIEDYSDIKEQSFEISHIDLIDTQLLNKDSKNSIIHIYIPDTENCGEAITYLTERLTASGISFNCTTNKVENTDWFDGWKKYFKPIETGSKIAVVPKWEKYDNIDNRKILYIDPGAAFGTGSHITTALCLEKAERFVRKNDTVLDIGCGSGILGIASILLGASNACCIDIDKTAVDVAKDNAKLNFLSDKVSFAVGDTTENIKGKYNVIFANIVADVIISLCNNIKDYMYDDTYFIVSGIIDIRVDEVRKAFENNSLITVEETFNDGWYAFVLKKEIN